MNNFYINFLVIVLTFVIIYLITKNNYESFENAEIVKPVAKVGLITFIRKPIDLPMWLEHHRNLGVHRFYIRIEDTPELEPYLKIQPDVWFEVGDSDKTGNNYQTLFDRQVVFIEQILKVAKKEKVEFLFNVDVDELLYGSLGFLDTLNLKYKTLVLENAEAVYSENEKSCFSTNKFLRCFKSDKCRAYANGKSGARVEEGVSSGGVHRFIYNGKNDGPNVYDVPFELLKILHFDSCSMGSWFEKFYHLSKNKKDNIPFPYYKDSIGALEKAFEVYKKYTMDYANNVPKEALFIKQEEESNNIELIISRYSENLDWTSEEPFNNYKYTVYNKGPDENFNKKNVKEIITLPNIGRCDHTYLYHVITNYDKLGKIVVFLPASLDMSNKISIAKKIITEIGKLKKAVFLGYKVNNVRDQLQDFHLDYYRATHGANAKTNDEFVLLPANPRPYGKWYDKNFGNIKINILCFYGIFSIDRRDILQNPKSHYEKLIKHLDSHSNPEAGHYFERSWAAVFHPLNNTVFVSND